MRKAPWFIHCLIRAEGMLDDLATPAENLRSRLQSLCHAIERVLVFEARDGANILRAARAQRAGAASLGIAVIDFFQFAQFAFADRRQRLAGRTNVDVLFRVVAELVLAEKAVLHRRPALRARHMRRQAGFLAGRDVFGPEITLVGDHIDFSDLENFPRRLRCVLQQAHVQDLVGHFLFDDHLVLCVDGDLNVVADPDLRMGGHGATVGIRERHLAFAVLFQRGTMRRIFAVLLSQRLDLFR